MSMPLLTSKFYKPSPRAGTIPRPHLLELLHTGLQRKLTIISAPAGFGKTTMVSAWITTTDYPTAWLSLDERDSDPLRFLAYIVAALQTIDPNIGQSVMETLNGSQSPAFEALLTSLLNELAAVPDDFLLVLDDYHLIESAQIDGMLAFLLDHLPPQMHLVIATREDPQLPLARLRARGQMTELRAADLRFSAAEAAEFLNQIMGLALSAEDVAALERRTEGWIAGLQLAALSLQGRPDTVEFIRAFTGSHRFVVDYLVDEVLQRQPAPVRRFLLHTSILDRLSGPLCAAVTGENGSQKMLETLERSNLFVIALDDERRWYRYHHLFAGALRNYLHSEHAEDVTPLHQRASDWYQQNNLPHDAIRHSLAAEDFAHAADLLEGIWQAMDETYQSAIWRAWVESLPRHEVENRPVLCHGLGRSLLYAGDLEACQMWLQAAETWLHTPEDERAAMRVSDPVLLAMLPAAINSARAYYSLALEDIPGTLRYAQQALDQLVPDDYLNRIQATVFLGIAHWFNGDLETADVRMSAFTAQMRDIGRIVDAIELVFVIADMRITRGQLRAAYDAYNQAFTLLANAGNPVIQGVEDLYRGVADLYREWNDLAAAEDHLIAAAEIAAQLVQRPNWHHRLNLSWAHLKLAQGDFAAALTFAETAEQHYIRSPLPDVQPVAAVKARIWIRQGQLRAADDWARTLRLDDEITYRHEYAFITLARLHVAHCETGAAPTALATALDLLERLRDAAQTSGRQGSLIEICLLQALAHFAQGDLTAALSPLAKALALAEPEGYIRLFVAEGPAMETLLEAAAQQHIAPDYVRRLRAAFDGPVPTASSTQPLSEPLSERELEVLRLLDTDLTGPEIARQLVVSLSTLRTHTRNIYSKLDVNNRRAAVRRASDLTLL